MVQPKPALADLMSRAKIPQFQRTATPAPNRAAIHPVSWRGIETKLEMLMRVHDEFVPRSRSRKRQPRKATNPETMAPKRAEALGDCQAREIAKYATASQARVQIERDARQP